ncbi:MAG TPA: hypothetical protein VI583_09435 [Cyclobacteriaceae bacterium]|nr:hypothetical protein [Cyclobacteriaceae bacterium]
MKHLIIFLIVADVVLTMFFLPWGMLANAAILIISMAIILPVLYYRTYKTFNKKNP